MHTEGTCATVSPDWVQLMNQASVCACRAASGKPGMGGSAQCSLHACNGNRAQADGSQRESIARDGDALLREGADELDNSCLSAYQPAATVFRYLNCFEPA